MLITSIRLNNYRNYSNILINPDSNINIITGPNGSGKTNILESVVVSSNTRSFRTNDDTSLIKHNEDYARIEVTADGTVYKIVLNKNGKSLFVNDEIITRTSNFIGRINAILFKPSDLEFFNSSPRERRKLIDLELGKINKNYLNALLKFNRLLKDKNRLLKENTVDDVYLNLINRATRYVYFFTPYLVLDQELMIAFENAAKSGVDVRLVLPGIPDKKLVYCLSRSHYKKLVEAGVKIYEYTPGFLHAKCAVCDDEYATVGSINLDYRSLYLHFECGVFMVHTPVVKSLYDDFDRVFRESKQITPEMCQRKHPFVVELFYTFLRLIAPLL